MNAPRVIIRLDDDDRVYQPGDTLSGEYVLESIPPERVKAVEVSSLWCTEGKGDEDLAVHDFRRSAAENGDWFSHNRPQRFNSTLPNSPLSYDGLIVKVRWCVRVRVFLGRGKELLGEMPFRLGSVPAASQSPLPLGEGDGEGKSEQTA